MQPLPSCMGQARTAPTRLPPAEVFGGVPVVMVSCGSRHTLVLTSERDVWSFGCGSWGRLGLGDVADRMVPTQLAGFAGVKVAFVAAGASHSVAVTVDGEVWSWGCGKHGCLGLNVEDRLVPALLGREKFGGAQIVLVAAGLSHTVAVCTDGLLWCEWAGEREIASERASDTVRVCVCERERVRERERESERERACLVVRCGLACDVEARMLYSCVIHAHAPTRARTHVHTHTRTQCGIVRVGYGTTFWQA